MMMQRSMPKLKKYYEKRASLRAFIVVIRNLEKFFTRAELVSINDPEIFSPESFRGFKGSALYFVD
jgi:hypothetical protein